MNLWNVEKRLPRQNQRKVIFFVCFLQKNWLKNQQNHFGDTKEKTEMKMSVKTKRKEKLNEDEKKWRKIKTKGMVDMFGNRRKVKKREKRRNKKENNQRQRKKEREE